MNKENKDKKVCSLSLFAPILGHPQGLMGWMEALSAN